MASKFGDRSSYAVVAAAENDELVIGLPAKQGLVRQSPVTIVNNFQFLNEDLTSDEFSEAKNHWFVTLYFLLKFEMFYGTFCTAYVKLPIIQSRTRFLRTILTER